ncbi:hypothetical protein EJV47_12840 [Hymenobacter gummosus]|uniref:SRPBCC family protein n=1 Tax=Hymenobacter gummosus TaxID=1776032 RepID=A0A3S0JH31_9BACT|nr:hypothetical protein [Hymenobacter gummosus]RTQ49694.1 hypothetical protein EJV47_12840 [Hymenobacter gummosus]
MSTPAKSRVQVLPPTVTFEQSWQFPAALQSEVAAYACQFYQPFWGQFTFHGNQRTATLPPFAGSAVITETLVEQTATGNSYTLVGLPGITDYVGSFELTPQRGGKHVRLRWRVRCRYQSTDALTVVAQVFAGGSGLMTTALQQQFDAQPAAHPV